MTAELPRVVAIADSDSYLKWSAATLAALPDGWQRTQWLIKNPIAPSAEQVRAATDGPVDRIGLVRLLVRLRRDPPEVILLAATGPVVQSILAAGFLRRAGRRPVLVTGLPGISIPATGRGIEFRSGCDLFIVHSQREVDDFSELARRLQIPIEFALASLPFFKQDRDPAHVVDRRPAASSGRHKIIFAAQAKVPDELAQRQQLLRAFAELPDDRRVVIKLRAQPGEQQTHREHLPYPELWAELVRTEGYDPDRIGFLAGSMADALADADGFVTVSSTAALEAIAAQVPILVLSDFGVSAELINEVFIGSGCLGTLADLGKPSGAGLRTPDPKWLQRNYFHPRKDANWIDRITDLLRLRNGAGLPARTPVNLNSSANLDGRRRLIRRQLRLALPTGLLRTTGRQLRRLRRVRDQFHDRF